MGTTRPAGQQEPLTALLDAVREDVNLAVADLNASDTQYRRRSLLRTFTAAIEGYTAVLNAGYFELRCEKPVGAAGAPRNERGLAKRFADALEACVRLTDPDYRLDRGRSGWRALRKSLSVRNRITHPLQLSDLSVSDEELEDLRQAVLWFPQATDLAFDAIGDKARKLIAALRKLPPPPSLRRPPRRAGAT
jgi:hypothetical protein